MTLLNWPNVATLFAMLACMPSSGRGAEADVLRVQFREVDTLFANPGQGWMSQQRSPRTEPRFPCSVVYVRFNWGDAEPAQGRFNWHLIDDVIAAWKPRGAAVAMRVMTCSAHSSGYYSSPKWLFDAGCKGFEYLVGGDDPTSGGKRIPRIEPDYADPIYLERHGAFLKALGQRYDGHPDVEFLDIGSYLQSRQWSFNAAVDFMLRNHVTLINDNIGRVPPEAMPELEKLARLAGARFVLREVAHEKTVRRGAPLNLQMTWANVGVGRLDHHYTLRFFLLDAAGEPVFKGDSKADPRDWLPGEQHLAESLLVPAALKAGEYRLAVALVDPGGQRRPFRLAMDAPENLGRYELSKVNVQ